MGRTTRNRCSQHDLAPRDNPLTCENQSTNHVDISKPQNQNPAGPLRQPSLGLPPPPLAARRSVPLSPKPRPPRRLHRRVSLNKYSDKTITCAVKSDNRIPSRKRRALDHRDDGAISGPEAEANAEAGRGGGRFFLVRPSQGGPTRASLSAGQPKKCPVQSPSPTPTNQPTTPFNPIVRRLTRHEALKVRSQLNTLD